LGDTDHVQASYNSSGHAMKTAELIIVRENKSLLRVGKNATLLTVR
jgi:hypothetical protein